MNSIADQLTPMMGSLQLHVEELKQLLWHKDEKIRRLEEDLNDKNIQIEELKSQLDKYQSVFFMHTPAPLSPGRRSPRRQRIVGISAEPHRVGSEPAFDDLIRHHPKPSR